jgi:hypothetical protein
MARAVNSGIAATAVRIDEAVGSESLWTFFCECGQRDCLSVVPLSVSRYTAVRDAAPPVVIAGGHEVVIGAWQARRLAGNARAEAAALRAQAEQVRRRVSAGPASTRLLDDLIERYGQGALVQVFPYLGNDGEALRWLVTIDGVDPGNVDVSIRPAAEPPQKMRAVLVGKGGEAEIASWSTKTYPQGPAALSHTLGALRRHVEHDQRP